MSWLPSAPFTSTTFSGATTTNLVHTLRTTWLVSMLRNSPTKCHNPGAGAGPAQIICFSVVGIFVGMKAPPLPPRKSLTSSTNANWKAPGEKYRLSPVSMFSR